MVQGTQSSHSNQNLDLKSRSKSSRDKSSDDFFQDLKKESQRQQTKSEPQSSASHKQRPQNTSYGQKTSRQEPVSEKATQTDKNNPRPSHMGESPSSLTRAALDAPPSQGTEPQKEFEPGGLGFFPNSEELVTEAETTLPASKDFFAPQKQARAQRDRLKAALAEAEGLATQTSVQTPIATHLEARNFPAEEALSGLGALNLANQTHSRAKRETYLPGMISSEAHSGQGLDSGSGMPLDEAWQSIPNQQVESFEQPLQKSFFSSQAQPNEVKAGGLSSSSEILRESLHNQDPEFMESLEKMALQSQNTKSSQMTNSPVPMGEFLAATEMGRLAKAGNSNPSQPFMDALSNSFEGSIGLTPVREKEASTDARGEAWTGGEYGLGAESGELIKKSPENMSMKSAEFEAVLEKPSQVKIDNMSSIVRQARAAIDDGGGEMQIHLQPEGLGKVQLKVAVQDGKVQLEMLTDNPAAKKALEDGLMDVRGALESHKLTVETAKVEMGQDYQKDFSDLRDHMQEQANREFAQDFLEQFRQGKEARMVGMIDRFRGFQPMDDPELKLTGHNPYAEQGKGRSLNLVA